MLNNSANRTYLRQIITAQCPELWSKCTCGEFIKTGPGLRVPQQRLWCKNNELSWKKSPQCFCEERSAAPSSLSWGEKTFHATRSTSFTVKWIKLIALKQPSPEFPRFLKKKKTQTTLSPIGPLTNLLRKSFSHASWSIAFMWNRGSATVRLKNKIFYQPDSITATGRV